MDMHEQSGNDLTIYFSVDPSASSSLSLQVINTPESCREYELRPTPLPSNNPIVLFPGFQ